MGHPYHVLANPFKGHAKLDEVLNSFRGVSSSVLFSKGMGPRDFVKALRKNEMIGMVVDQGNRTGIRVPFLGRTASMSVGAIKMAMKWNVAICVSVIVKNEDGNTHCINVHSPLKIVDTGNYDEDLKTNVQNVINVMEPYVRKYPEDYLWLYKVWKYSDETDVTILSDGRAGHLNQSKAAAQFLTELYSGRDVKCSINVVEPKFKSDKHAKMFSLFAKVFGGFVGQGRLAVLRNFLTDDSYDEIRKINSDNIVSTGSLMAGLNFIVSRECGARNVVIQRPGIFSLKKFNLVLLPLHDLKGAKISRKTRNVVLTYGSVNQINESHLKEQADLLKERFKSLDSKKRKTIGVFVGGDSKNSFVSEEDTKELVGQIKGLCKKFNARVLITTSRRTSSSVEELLEKEFGGSDDCPLLIIANRENYPEVAGGIMGLSDVIFVSGDSISMVSESMASGKPTVVFYPRFQKKNTKHEVFVKGLARDGFVSAVKVEDVGETASRIFKGKIKLKIIDDKAVVCQALRKVI